MEIFKKFGWAVAATLLVVVAGVGILLGVLLSDNAQPDVPLSPEDIAISAVDMELVVGEMQKLSASVSPESANLTFTTKNKNIAEIDNGYVVGVGAGSCKILIKAVYENILNQTEITVKVVKESTNKVQYTLEKSTLYLLNKNIEAANADGFYSSSKLTYPNDCQLSIDGTSVVFENGNLVARSVGKSTITLTPPESSEAPSAKTIVATSFAITVKEIEIEKIEVDLHERYSLALNDSINFPSVTFFPSYHTQTENVQVVLSSGLAWVDNKIVAGAIGTEYITVKCGGREIFVSEIVISGTTRLMFEINVQIGSAGVFGNTIIMSESARIFLTLKILDENGNEVKESPVINAGSDIIYWEEITSGNYIIIATSLGEVEFDVSSNGFVYVIQLIIE